MNDNIVNVVDEIPWLIFRLNEKLYTLNSRMITSILIKPEEITFVPNVPHYIEGLIHLRGNVVPLINLKLLLDLKENGEVVKDSKESKEMAVILEKDNLLLGLLVDQVLSVENINEYERTDEIKKVHKDGYVIGVAKGQKNDQVLLVIDEEKIMNIAWTYKLFSVSDEKYNEVWIVEVL